MPQINDKQLRYLEYANRENDIRHHKYDEEMLQYELLAAGDEHAIEESIKVWESGTTGHLFDDPVKNMKYLCVASITLATRFAIQGGMQSELAYNTSDLYIRKFDACKSYDELRAVHKDMFTFFTHKMSEIKKESVYSKQILLCMDYIFYHLHEKITVDELATNVELNPSYLSTLFKKETGKTISEYILVQKIDTAKNMLKYSDYTYSEIASILAFSSQSHFSNQFKKLTGQTPKVYRDTNFRMSVFQENKGGQSK